MFLQLPAGGAESPSNCKHQAIPLGSCLTGLARSLADFAFRRIQGFGVFDDDPSVGQRRIDSDMKGIALSMMVGRGFDHYPAADNWLTVCFQFLNSGFDGFPDVRYCRHISKCDLCRNDHDSPHSEISLNAACHFSSPSWDFL